MKKNVPCKGKEGNLNSIKMSPLTSTTIKNSRPLYVIASLLFHGVSRAFLPYFPGGFDLTKSSSLIQQKTSILKHSSLQRAISAQQMTTFQKLISPIIKEENIKFKHKRMLKSSDNKWSLLHLIINLLNQQARDLFPRMIRMCNRLYY